MTSTGAIAEEVMIVPTWRDSSGGGGRWAARSAAAPTPTPAPAAAPPKRVPFSKRVADLFLDDTPEADFTHSAAAAALAAAAATPSPAPPPAPASAPTAAASSVHSSAQVTPLKRPSDMSASAKSPSRRRGGGGASSLVGGRRLDRVGAAGPDAPLARLGGVEVLRRPNPMREDIPSNHKLTDPVAMSNIEARTLTEFDALFRQKNYSMGMLVTVELALMILVFQYPWNATTGHYDSEATSVWVLQTVLTFLTAWHLWKVWDYYQLVLVSDRVKYALRSRDGILQSFRLKYMLVEMLLVLLHSVPYVMETKPELFIFGRMYQLFRVVRDHSPVYRWRKQILTRGHLSGLPEFDVSLTLRTYFHLYPWPTLFIFISWWLLVLSYAVYIFERELQPTKFGFANTVYFTAGTMTALGYGDMVPISDGGRTVSLVAVVVGILCSALLVTALLRQIRLTPNQVRIAEFVAEEQLMREERAVAARLIQKAWRKFVAHRREQAREGVEIMMVTDDGIARLKPQEARARQARTHGLCHTSCCGMYDQPPTDQEVLNAAKKNRELRYYRFLTNMANSSNINQLTSMEQRMERIEDMMLYMLEVLATMQTDAAVGSLADVMGDDPLSGAATTETSPHGSRPASATASHLAARALQTTEMAANLQRQLVQQQAQLLQAQQQHYQDTISPTPSLQRQTSGPHTM